MRRISQPHISASSTTPKLRADIHILPFLLRHSRVISLDNHIPFPSLSSPPLVMTISIKLTRGLNGAVLGSCELSDAKPSSKITVSSNTYTFTIDYSVNKAGSVFKCEGPGIVTPTEKKQGTTSELVSGIYITSN